MTGRNKIYYLYQGKKPIMCHFDQKYKMLFTQPFLADSGEIQLSREIHFSEYWMMRLKGD